MSTEENKAIVRRLFDEFLSKGNSAVADELLDTHIVAHDPGFALAPGLSSGREDVKQFFLSNRPAFPDSQVPIEDMIAEGDRVAVRWTFRGANTGSFAGMPATGKQVAMTGMWICRIAGGKIVEYWSQPDLLGMMQQLGVAPLGAAGEQREEGARQATAATLTVEQFEEQETEVTTEPSDRIEELLEPQQERQPASKVGSPIKETTAATLTVEQFEEQETGVTTEPSNRIEELLEPQQERQPASKVGSPIKETTAATLTVEQFEEQETEVTTEPSDRIEELLEPQQERQPASEVGSPTKETTAAAQKEGD